MLLKECDSEKNYASALSSHVKSFSHDKKKKISLRFCLGVNLFFSKNKQKNMNAEINARS